MLVFSCECSSGARTEFKAAVDTDEFDPTKKHVYVRPSAPGEPVDDFYYALLKEVANATWQTLTLMNQLPEEYHGCRISARLIPALSISLGCRIRSSRAPTGPVPNTLSSGDVDERNEAADAVWRSLLASGLAEYDAEEDRYYHPPR
jgi:hypothetical protein